MSLCHGFGSPLPSASTCGREDGGRQRRTREEGDYLSKGDLMKVLGVESELSPASVIDSGASIISIPIAVALCLSRAIC